VGASKNGKIIATYDWTMMVYQEVLHYNDRYLASCGLLRKPNGQIFVAIAGKIGNEKSSARKMLFHIIAKAFFTRDILAHILTKKINHGT
jgi:hypothetical protein